MLINDSQHAEVPPVICTVSHKAIRPHVPLMLRSQPHTGAVVKPKPAAFGLLLWDFKPLTSPDPFHSLNVDSPSVATDQSRDTTVTVSAILLCQADNIGCQMRFVEGHNLRLTLCGTMLTDDAACPTLGYTDHIAHVVNCQPAVRRA
ncbi:hypothetical protein GCM10009069_05050 [Algimonas arctica]|uniref:Uncharacterized protein n=1 Tax=Algimonas arctica TaxID=1479486 RepID=A0A8J3CQ68_9PROT|nr:hypothetical protein GCM10009069_05050 [Algimonas arctica]